MAPLSRLRHRTNLGTSAANHELFGLFNGNILLKKRPKKALVEFLGPFLALSMCWLLSAVKEKREKFGTKEAGLKTIPLVMCHPHMNKATTPEEV